MSPLPYRPHPLLRNGHLQTLMVGLANDVGPTYQARMHTVDLDDDESLVVHEETRCSVGRYAPLIILVHGLGGDHRSAYLERLAPQLNMAGWLVWRVDLRGCGHGLHLAWQPPNAGRSEDLAAVVRAAGRLHPDREIHICGFSLSGNILLKMLGELATGKLEAPLHRINSALAIAPPVNLHECANNMDRFSRRIYTHYYLRVLHEQVRERQRHWPQWQRVPVDPQVRTIRDFDKRYTAPLSGFSSVDEYYSQSSALPWLPAIETPTTVLIDQDDPIVNYNSFQQAQFNAQTTQVLETRHGGHMGYFGVDEEGRMIRWMEFFVLKHLKQFLL